MDSTLTETEPFSFRCLIARIRAHGRRDRVLQTQRKPLLTYAFRSPPTQKLRPMAACFTEAPRVFSSPRHTRLVGRRVFKGRSPRVTSSGLCPQSFGFAQRGSSGLLVGCSAEGASRRVSLGQVALAEPCRDRGLGWLAHVRLETLRSSQAVFHLRWANFAVAGNEPFQGTMQKTVGIGHALVCKQHQPFRERVLQIVMRFPAMSRLTLLQQFPPIPEGPLQRGTRFLVVATWSGWSWLKRIHVTFPYVQRLEKRRHCIGVPTDASGLFAFLTDASAADTARCSSALIPSALPNPPLPSSCSEEIVGNVTKEYALPRKRVADIKFS